ncbi:MAG: hypothetical protein FVQ82_13115 [Planctomycetes bacterium]|nr:hypothetical protein [Planctomycetota bacterium]
MFLMNYSIFKVAKLSKNSSTSSKPPSSDIVKPPRKKKNNGSRNIGGQPGHPKHERDPFTTEEIDTFQTHTLDVCPDGGGKLEEVQGAEKIVQQVEIVQKPTHIEQHTGLRYWCEHCQKFHDAPMPAHIDKGQLVGPRLMATIAYMKGACHCSFSTIRKFLRDVVGVTISRGQLSKLAEQAIRFVVIDRYLTQGTRSENGRNWSERIWTVMATCASQGRNAFDFIYQSIQAHFSNQPFSSLLGP